MKKIQRIWKTPEGDQIQFLFDLSSDGIENLRVYFYTGNMVTDLTEVFEMSPFDNVIDLIYTGDCEPA